MQLHIFDIPELALTVRCDVPTQDRDQASINDEVEGHILSFLKAEGQENFQDGGFVHLTTLRQPVRFRLVPMEWDYSYYYCGLDVRAHPRHCPQFRTTDSPTWQNIEPPMTVDDVVARVAKTPRHMFDASEVRPSGAPICKTVTVPKEECMWPKNACTEIDISDHPRIQMDKIQEMHERELHVKINPPITATEVKARQEGMRERMDNMVATMEGVLAEGARETFEKARAREEAYAYLAPLPADFNFMPTTSPSREGLGQRTQQMKVRDLNTPANLLDEYGDIINPAAAEAYDDYQLKVAKADEEARDNADTDRYLAEGEGRRVFAAMSYQDTTGFTGMAHVDTLRGQL